MKKVYVNVEDVERAFKIYDVGEATEEDRCIMFFIHKIHDNIRNYGETVTVETYDPKEKL